MRNLKQLYTILYDAIKDLDKIYGICYEIGELQHAEIITAKEWGVLLSHFKSQRNLHPEFMTLKRNWATSGSLYWWTEDEDRNPINRKAFVKKLMDTV